MRGTPWSSPHPAEQHDAYAGFTVIGDGRVAERDERVVNAAGVVGGTSTALLNVSALYGVPAARVIAPGLERLETELGVDQRALLDTYLPPAVDARRWSGLSSKA